MVDLLIEHGEVITIDPDRRVIPDGAVAVDGGRIVAVGSTEELSAYQGDARRRIDARRKAVLPGLIDVHAHAGHGLVKTIGGGVGNQWATSAGAIYRHHAPPSFWAAEARLAALERLKCGVTTGLSMLGGGDGAIRTDRPDHALAHARAVRDIGLRSVLCLGASRTDFARTFTDNVGDEGLRCVPYEVQLEASRSAFETLATERGDLDLMFCITASVMTPAMLDGGAIPREMRRLADAAMALVTEMDTLFTQDSHCRGSIAISGKLGLLGPRAIMSHCIDLEAEEIALLARTGTHVVTNPSANFSIIGRCPVIEMLDAGVNVAIGSDGTAPDRSSDMFRHMQTAMHYHRRHFRDKNILPPGKALEMVTIDAARALGQEAQLGSLEPGKRSDIILIDLAAPHLMPLHMALWRVVSFANGADVDTVIVDGKVLMEGRRTTLDEDAILDDAQAEADRAIDAAGLRGMLNEPADLWRGTRFG